MREVYAGLDVSDKQTHICLVDGAGAVLWRGRCASDPDVIAKTLAKHTAKLLASLARAAATTFGSASPIDIRDLAPNSPLFLRRLDHQGMGNPRQFNIQDLIII